MDLAEVGAHVIGLLADEARSAGIALAPWLVSLLQVGAFVGKVAVVIFVLMLIRWTLPRFRYDQAMRLGWLGLFPLAIANIVLTGLVLAAWGNH